MKPQEIIDLRKRTGLNQKEFAAFLGVSNLTTNRWESGRTEPNPLAVRVLTELKEKLDNGQIICEFEKYKNT